MQRKFTHLFHHCKTKRRCLVAWKRTWISVHMTALPPRTLQKEGLALWSHSVIRFIPRHSRSRLVRDVTNVTSGPKRLRPTRAKSVRDVSCIPIIGSLRTHWPRAVGLLYGSWI